MSTMQTDLASVGAESDRYTPTAESALFLWAGTGPCVRAPPRPPRGMLTIGSTTMRVDDHGPNMVVLCRPNTPKPMRGAYLLDPVRRVFWSLPTVRGRGTRPSVLWRR